MTTALKGNTTEATVLKALVERDLAVLVPFGEGHPYDLVVHVDQDRFLRIQCKTARLRNGCVRFNSRSTDHGNGAGTYHGLADLFGVHCRHNDATYLIPVAEVPGSVVYLRAEPTRNNQKCGVRYAAEFEIGRWSVERLLALPEHHPPRKGQLPLPDPD